MTREQLKRALKKAGLTQLDIAVKLGTSQQNFNNKVRRMSFSDAELSEIAEMVGARYVSCFEFSDGERI